MKKIVCLILAILVCSCLVFPAVANGFVKSITYKGSPELVTEHGGNIVLHNEEDVLEVIDATEEGCLIITPVSEAKETTAISEEAKELLLKVYKELSDGTMVLPYDKVEGIDADKMVIRELLDITLVCDHEHREDLKREDVGIELIFDLGVAKDAVMTAMSYVDDEWVPALEVVNNGDGTVTVVLEDLCPVAFSIEA